jgi:hypothetical protein
MYWRNGLTASAKAILKQKRRDEKIRKLSTPHGWFAWYPVTVEVTEDQHQVKAWLVRVAREATWAQYIHSWSMFRGWHDVLVTEFKYWRL